MTQFEVAEAGVGRIVVGRLHPGTDLVGGLEAVCDAHGIRFAAIMSCYGSLSAAGFKFLQVPPGEERPRLVPHRVDERVEFMGGQGLVCETPDGGRETHLHGSISDATGTVTGGHFVSGENPVYNNMDLVLQELLDVRLIREYDAATDTVEMRVDGAEPPSLVAGPDQRILLAADVQPGPDPATQNPASAVSRGVVDFERSVVIRSGGVGGAGQDTSSRFLAPSTSLVWSSSGVGSSRAIEP